MSLYRLRSAAILLIFLATAASRALAAQAVYHVLQKGETIYAVARHYEVSVEAIIVVNGIADPSKIQPGQKLLIPLVHKVAKGETLYGIAKSLGVAVDTLRNVNKLSPQALIKPGDILLVPAAKPGGSGSLQSVSADSGSKPGTETLADPRTGGSADPKSGPPPGGSAGAPAAGPGAFSLSPPTVRISTRTVDKHVSWPCSGDAVYLDGKLYGVMIRSKEGEAEKAVAGGTVVSAGPYRGFGQVAFVQSRNGHIYVYGGNGSLGVRVGDSVRPGQELGKVGIDVKESGPVAYFFVFRNGEAVDPAIAPRE